MLSSIYLSRELSSTVRRVSIDLSRMLFMRTTTGKISTFPLIITVNFLLILFSGVHYLGYMTQMLYILSADPIFYMLWAFSCLS